MGLQRKQFTRHPLDDAEIIDLYWQRDEKAIEETDIKYQKYLFSVAYRILQDRLDCEECVNDTYVGAWDSIPPTKPKVFKAFLSTLTRRIAVNRYHSNRKKSSIPSEMTVALSELEAFWGEEDPAEDFDNYRLGRVISDHLRTLSPRARFIFMSRYYMANTVDRIAADLRVSRSTVNKELAFIRTSLKEKLESEGYLV